MLSPQRWWESNLQHDHGRSALRRCVWEYYLLSLLIDEELHVTSFKNQSGHLTSHSLHRYGGGAASAICYRSLVCSGFSHRVQTACDKHSDTCGRAERQGSVQLHSWAEGLASVSFGLLCANRSVQWTMRAIHHTTGPYYTQRSCGVIITYQGQYWWSRTIFPRLA